MAGSIYTSGGDHHLIKITLKGRDNETFTGAFLLRNLTALLGVPRVVPPPRDLNQTTEDPLIGSPGHPEDPSGASYYVIAVVLVYGMSIVMLIASHIKRKHAKLVEDKQIHKYLQEFLVVKERSSRDSYKTLKSSIMAKLNMHHRTSTYRTLSHAILPMMAVGLPTLQDDGEQDVDSVRTLRRASFQVGAFRHVNPAPITKGRRASELDITTFKHLRNPQRNSHLSRMGSKEHINLVRYGSLRGGYHGKGDHLLPSSIEEEIPATVASEVPIIKVTHRDIDRRNSGVPGPHHSEEPVVSTATLKENVRCKPISVSKDCRVYEIPMNKPLDNALRPGGFHIPLLNSRVYKPEKCLSSSDLSDNTRDWPNASVNYYNHKEVHEITPMLEYDTSLIDSWSTGATLKNANVVEVNVDNGRANTSMHTSTSHLPNGDLDKSMQFSNVQSPLGNNEQQSTTQNSRPQPSTSRTRPDQNQQINARVATSLSEYPSEMSRAAAGRRLSSVSCSSARNQPVQLDVVVNVHQRPARAHSFSARSPVGAAHAQSGHSGRAAASFITARSSQEISSPKRCSNPCEASCPSENSSDSDDVWTMMSPDRRSQQAAPADLNDCPTFPEMALRSAGTSPLLTPKDSSRLDSNDSAKGPSAKSYSSRSESPTTSQTDWDTDTLLPKLHQVTSV